MSTRLMAVLMIVNVMASGWMLHVEAERKRKAWCSFAVDNADILSEKGHRAYDEECRP